MIQITGTMKMIQIPLKDKIQIVLSKRSQAQINALMFKIKVTTTELLERERESLLINLKS